MDPTSRSNGHSFLSKHVKIDWNVDFELKALRGHVTLTIEVLAKTNMVVLDTMKIDVHEVELLSEGSSEQLKFEFLGAHAAFGQPLKVNLPKYAEKGDQLVIQISYTTGKDHECSALQWMSKEQTADKVHDFMYSQCQAIHARALLPCFDYPAQKFTYEAKLTIPEGTGCVALMSAVPTKTEGNVFHFEQQTPIPSYLLALAVGALEKADISERCAVYAEKSLIEACAYEFQPTEDFLATGEKLFGAYEWKRYDMLILPPSFPYGGMENPCLTFVTPTLLAKDRSLINVVAHEISHSWTGNLVTNASWDHFWLNEGCTVMAEFKIYSKTMRPNDPVAERKLFDLKALIAWDELEETVNQFGADHPFTQLNIDHSKDGGIDPDDAFSRVPYYKGALFLCYLENLVGGPEIFEPFMKAYIAEYKMKAIVTEDFVFFFNNYFTKLGKEETIKDIDWKKWRYNPGMLDPEVRNIFDSSLYDRAKEIGLGWTKGEYIPNAQFVEMSTDEKLIIFSIARTSDTPINCSKLEELYSFSKQENAEVIFRWFVVCINNGYEDILTPKLLDFLRTVGRMKYARPLYRALNAQGGKFKETALDVFKKYRSGYHAISQKMIAKDLGLE